jgi:hypothetical protein
MSAVDGIDEFAAKLAGILKEKNAAYGDSFARVPTILAGMYQDVPPETLEGILFNARIQDKLGRIAQDPLGAGEDAFLDLAGYALLQANVQRLKREAKPKAAEPKSADISVWPHVIEWSPKRWVVRRAGPRGCAGVEYLCTSDNTWRWAGYDAATVFPTWDAAEKARGDVPVRTFVHGDADLAAATVKDSLTVEEAKAEPPIEPNGRIKRDILPYVKVSECPTGWYLSCLKGVQGADTMFFNAYAGGFWGPDRRNATSFPSADAAEAYLRKQAELNGSVKIQVFEAEPPKEPSLAAVLAAHEASKGPSCE